MGESRLWRFERRTGDVSSRSSRLLARQGASSTRNQWASCAFGPAVARSATPPPWSPPAGRYPAVLASLRAVGALGPARPVGGVAERNRLQRGEVERPDWLRRPCRRLMAASIMAAWFPL